jgi:hypothetical protein
MAAKECLVAMALRETRGESSRLMLRCCGKIEPLDATMHNLCVCPKCSACALQQRLQRLREIFQKRTLMKRQVSAISPDDTEMMAMCAKCESQCCCNNDSWWLRNRRVPFQEMVMLAPCEVK